jgi:phage protein U
MSAYLQLGSVRLDLIAHVEGFEGENRYSYAEHEIIEGKNHLQWVGDELMTRTLDCQLHARFCDPHAEYLKLKAAAERHRAMLLYFACGIIEGMYVIRSIQRTLQHTDKLGKPYALTLRIDLEEYVLPQGPNQPTGWLGELGQWLGLDNPGEQLVGIGLELASDPEGFLKVAGKNILGDVADVGLDLLGPLGPVANNIYSLAVRQQPLLLLQ